MMTPRLFLASCVCALCAFLPVACGNDVVSIADDVDSGSNANTVDGSTHNDQDGGGAVGQNDGGAATCTAPDKGCCTANGFACVGPNEPCQAVSGPSACPSGTTTTPSCQLGVTAVACTDDSACSAYGATCEPAQVGMRCRCIPCGGASDPSCSAGTACQVFADAGHCVEAPCTPGQDETCNNDPAAQSNAGTCRADHTCQCVGQHYIVTATGKCM